MYSIHYHIYMLDIQPIKPASAPLEHPIQVDLQEAHPTSQHPPYIAPINNSDCATTTAFPSSS
ncbi:hypothetical protein GCM10008018_22280 [Paenibacillus marchantiophytorum]|uniref:Uncharacterized protein n=1 Tax=Paenibacillus marchantiophytorum TaxID=1619310 RepID=A0ABQ1EKS5_9BACL|nr:hypothetical protein GCM10008018_22280 [Paenibacillus marchantiophytorum]